MNETALVQKVWNYAHVLRDQGVPYQSYISQISYLLFLKMDDERAELVKLGVIPRNGSPIPEDCRWPVLRDLQGEELTSATVRSWTSWRVSRAWSAPFSSRRRTKSRTLPSSSGWSA
jgi:type I restriction enzyme M protein